MKKNIYINYEKSYFAAIRRPHPKMPRYVITPQGHTNHHTITPYFGYFSSQVPSIGDHNGNSSVSDRVTGIKDKSSADDYSGKEAIRNHIKACGTPKGSCHAAGITDTLPFEVSHLPPHHHHCNRCSRCQSQSQRHRNTG